MKKLRSTKVELKKGVAYIRKPVSAISATEAFVRSCSSESVFLTISQYLKENPCVGLTAYIKKRLQHSCFPVSIAKFLRIAFL